MGLPDSTEWEIKPKRPKGFQPQEVLDRSPRMIPSALEADELCQLAMNWDPASFPRDAVVDVKKDGIRSLFIGGGYKMLTTREGHPMACAEQCLDGLRALERQYRQPMVFDMEYDAGSFEHSLAAFKSETRTGSVWVFDAIPLAAWMRNAQTASLISRKGELMMHARAADMAYVGILPGMHCDDVNEALRMAETAWAFGEEGIMVKDGRSRYWRGRSPTWMKIKQELTGEAAIIGISKTGGLICQTDTLKQFVIPLAGKKRTQVLQHRDVKGMIVEYIYAGLNPSGIPREARYNRLREDLRSKA